MRCPSGDLPGAGPKVRGTTGPSSEVAMVVDPSGGGVMDDDRGPFGAKSLSRGWLQLWVLRQRTLSRKRIRRTWLRLMEMCTATITSLLTTISATGKIKIATDNNLRYQNLSYSHIPLSLASNKEVSPIYVKGYWRSREYWRSMFQNYVSISLSSEVKIMQLAKQIG